MRQSVRKLVAPVAIFLVFCGFALLSSPTLAPAYGKMAALLYYVVRIGVVVSGLFCLYRVMDLLIWDHLLARALGRSIPQLAKDVFAILLGGMGLALIVGGIFEKPLLGIWATSGVMSIILGFALRSLILDVFTGLAINIDNSYSIGEWVQVHTRNRADFIGRITGINWRTTSLVTIDQDMVIIPNSLVGRSIRDYQDLSSCNLLIYNTIL